MEKIGLNIKEASQYLGINEKLMTQLIKTKGFQCIKFQRIIGINKLELGEWFKKNAGKHFGF